jgi:predicted ferric reductase
MVVAVATAIALVRRHAYETFVRMHQILAIAVVAGVLVHRPGNIFQIPNLYLFIAACLWVILRLLRVLIILVRNDQTRATIWSLPDAFQVHVRVGRPWAYRAGQYVYLRLRKGIAARMQSHPYFVSWWYVDEDGRDVVVLIIGRQKGFSNGLGDHSNDNLILTKKDDGGHFIPAKDEDGRLLLASDAIKLVASVKADIEGPYGQAVELAAYGTVLLFASGTGIAGVLPFIRQLLVGYHNRDAKVRKLALFWEIKSDRRFGRSS